LSLKISFGHRRVKEMEVTLSVCHDDLGLAVANSLIAIQNGARQVECTINGIGERAGNASLEEIVMALRTRGDLLQFHTRILPKHIFTTSRLVSKITGMVIQPKQSWCQCLAVIRNPSGWCLKRN
jgi:2-isopropylmalate synthase